jgi:ribosome biogenesis ATPase
MAGMEAVLMDLVDMLIVIKANDQCKQRTLLLHGPPGCGKTMLANAIAGQLKWPLIEVTATEIVSGVSGESESKLRSLFEQASDAGPCVLFMDEIEVIAQKKEGSSASR